jgi:hypothetical protein
VTIETKQAVEFGRLVTLYRVVSADGKSTLWHSTEAKAVGHAERRGWK